MTLREDLQVKVEEQKELTAALNANENEQMTKLNNQVLKLSALVQKLQRGLNAKQTFCESLVTENGRLKEMMEATKNERNERIIEVTHLKKELGEQLNQPGMKEIMDGVYDHVDGAELQVCSCLHADMGSRDWGIEINSKIKKIYFHCFV